MKPPTVVRKCCAITPSLVKKVLAATPAAKSPTRHAMVHTSSSQPVSDRWLQIAKSCLSPSDTRKAEEFDNETSPELVAKGKDAVDLEETQEEHIRFRHRYDRVGTESHGG